MNEQMRARPWVVHAQIDLARVLAQSEADRERAAELFDAALAEARALGMPRVASPSACRSRADHGPGLTSRSGRTTAHPRRRLR